MNGSGSLNRTRLPNSLGGHDDASHNAALKGASLAFQKSTPKKLLTTATSRNTDNEALIAATSAASASASRDHSRTVSRQTTGNSIQGGSAEFDFEQGIVGQSSKHHLQPPSERNHGSSSYTGLASRPAMPDPRSPSFIAATLAASRSASPVRHQTAQSQPHTQQPVRRAQKHSVSADNSAASSVTSLDLATDITSIPPTNTLISMFEKREGDTDPVKKDIAASDTRKSLGPKLRSRPITPPRTLSPIVKNDLSPSSQASSTVWGKTASPPASISRTTQEKPRQTQNAVVGPKGQPPTPPPTRTKNKPNTSTNPRPSDSKEKPRVSTPPLKAISRTDTVILSPRPRRSTSQKILLNDIQAQDFMPQGQTLALNKPKAQPPVSIYGPLDSSPTEDDLHRISTSSNDTFVSASSTPSPQLASRVRGRSRPSSRETVRPRRPPSAQTVSSATTLVERPPTLPRRKAQPAPSNLPLDSLTDAIMAGSLASSRLTPSTVQTPPPKPPPRRQTPHMRQTLRQPPSKSDDEEPSSRARSHRRKPLGKLGGGNKHSHHEGARKRWREEITARERKRYEGVWASNRGLLLADADGGGSFRNALQVQDQSRNQMSKEKDTEMEKEQVVANVIVRDIWARSRLPFDELAEVWDLVDRRGRGFLDRTEFVVGMWLIDQRLRGRKIPAKVTESVWGSASGVRIHSPKKKKK